MHERTPVTALKAKGRLSDYDVYLFKQGNHYRLYDKLGARPLRVDGVDGAHFALWAPNAHQVSVIGDFNGWRPDAHVLRSDPHGSGIWEGFIPGLGVHTLYKYHVVSNYHHYAVEKADPFALYTEVPPRTASVVWDLDYTWQDGAWMENRRAHNGLDRPWSIYELHLGSWRRVPEQGNRPLSYRELALELPRYLDDLGFTHVELMPVTEHPFYGSWGYQTTGYFAPSSRYGSPQDFMHLVDTLHRHGIGVILDWVPSHFPGDAHGLSFFDGTHLYEHADPRRGFHPEWRSYIFNYGRNEVKAFLISSALFWLERYHIDALRVDAVASMLYLDYARRDGEWIPNEHGGKENLEAIAFLRALNEAVYQAHPDVQTIAEESTAWPMVSRPTYVGGLGFGMKWNMGWMHDTLDYFAKDPIHRKYHQNEITFSLWYAFTENYVLPLSHDEVVYGKQALLSKMPGDDWQKFANLRLLLGYMYAHPGKKLLFMGAEFGQWAEWNHEHSLDWHLAGYERHAATLAWLRALNRLYRHEPALHARDFAADGFEWIDTQDWEHSILSFLRKDADGHELMVVCNFTPTPHPGYRVGCPREGRWQLVLNGDDARYGGSGYPAAESVQSERVPAHGRAHSLALNLPPLATVFFKRAR